MMRVYDKLGQHHPPGGLSRAYQRRVAAWIEQAEDELAVICQEYFNQKRTPRTWEPQTNYSS